jgi:hypothetical protein
MLVLLMLVGLSAGNYLSSGASSTSIVSASSGGGGSGLSRTLSNLSGYSSSPNSYHSPFYWINTTATGHTITNASFSRPYNTTVLRSSANSTTAPTSTSSKTLFCESTIAESATVSEISIKFVTFAASPASIETTSNPTTTATTPTDQATMRSGYSYIIDNGTMLFLGDITPTGIYDSTVYETATVTVQWYVNSCSRVFGNSQNLANTSRSLLRFLHKTHGNIKVTISHVADTPADGSSPRDKGNEHLQQGHGDETVDFLSLLCTLNLWFCY